VESSRDLLSRKSGSEMITTRPGRE